MSDKDSTVVTDTLRPKASCVKTMHPLFALGGMGGNERFESIVAFLKGCMIAKHIQDHDTDIFMINEP